jgi:hypothetical protein
MKFHARHLARIKWRFFATLAFRRSSTSLSMADRRFEAWISDLQDDDDDSDEEFLWFRVNPHGAFPDKPLFHVLIAGLCAFDSSLTECWGKHGGDIKSTQIVGQGDAWAFIFDIARHGGKFEIKHDLLRV